MKCLIYLVFILSTIQINSQQTISVNHKTQENFNCDSLSGIKDPNSPNSGIVKGSVKDFKGRNLKYVTVTVKANNTITEVTCTNNEGIYKLYNLNGTYNIDFTFKNTTKTLKGVKVINNQLLPLNPIIFTKKEIK